MEHPTPLAAWMEATGKSDLDFSKEMGVSRPFISRLRRGDRKPSIEFAKRLSERTEIPLAKLVPHLAALIAA